MARSARIGQILISKRGGDSIGTVRDPLKAGGRAKREGGDLRDRAGFSSGYTEEASNSGMGVNLAAEHRFPPEVISSSKS